EETVRKRIKVYHAQTEPLLHYYQKENLLSRVDAGGTPDEVLAAVEAAVGSNPIPRWKLSRFPR
ncbi:MAG: hypothetical protein ACREJQ_01715, partial [bacterium]